MKATIITLLAWIVSTPVFAQELNSDHRIIHVNQQVNQILSDNPNESPLANYVACLKLWASGSYDSIYSEMIDHSVRRSHNAEISSQYAENLLSSTILDVVIYRDSVGLVIRKDHTSPSYLLIGCSVFENGRWRAFGEDVSWSDELSVAHQRVIDRSPTFLPKLRKYYQQSKVSQDTLAFTKYLQNSGSNPKEYLLSKLSNHKLVIYGEVHRRKSSWDYLKEAVLDSRFPEICGTIFLELPTHTQSKFDTFLANDKLDMEIILNILRDEQIYGWQDRGEYEFIEELWKVNKRTKNKIKIIPVDFQIPWDSIRSNLDYEDYVDNKMKDRDSTMASTIEQTMKTDIDSRNSLYYCGSESH